MRRSRLLPETRERAPELVRVTFLALDPGLRLALCHNGLGLGEELVFRPWFGRHVVQVLHRVWAVPKVLADSPVPRRWARLGGLVDAQHEISRSRSGIQLQHLVQHHQVVT